MDGDSLTAAKKGGDARQGDQRRPWAFILFLLPIGAVIVPAVYSRVHPSVGGVPFFVWYQFAAVVLGAVVTGIVYVLRGTERNLTRPETPRPPQCIDAGSNGSRGDGSVR